MSWDYSHNPLIINKGSIIDNYRIMLSESIQRQKRLLELEERINIEFIHTYDLDDELCASISPEQCSIKIPESREVIINLISFAVGCMFGRYSIEKSISVLFVDEDNIIPINENEYFGDDIVSKFIDFIKTTFGNECLEENLKYVANILYPKKKGTSRDKIRLYFLNDFIKDHLKMYFGFKALIYMHRYTPDLIGKMRQDYLLPMQRRYSEQLKMESDSIARSKLEKKLEEIATYDLAMELYSSNKVSIDLDDGIKVNYAKFQNIDNPGGKGKINLLYKIK